MSSDLDEVGYEGAPKGELCTKHESPGSIGEGNRSNQAVDLGSQGGQEEDSWENEEDGSGVSADTSRALQNALRATHQLIFHLKQWEGTVRKDWKKIQLATLAINVPSGLRYQASSFIGSLEQYRFALQASTGVELGRNKFDRKEWHHAQHEEVEDYNGREAMADVADLGMMSFPTYHPVHFYSNIKAHIEARENKPRLPKPRIPDRRNYRQRPVSNTSSPVPRIQRKAGDANMKRPGNKFWKGARIPQKVLKRASKPMIGSKRRGSHRMSSSSVRSSDTPGGWNYHTSSRRGSEEKEVKEEYPDQADQKVQKQEAKCMPKTLSGRPIRTVNFIGSDDERSIVAKYHPSQHPKHLAESTSSQEHALYHSERIQGQGRGTQVGVRESWTVARGNQTSRQSNLDIQDTNDRESRSSGSSDDTTIGPNGETSLRNSTRRGWSLLGAQEVANRPDEVQEWIDWFHVQRGCSGESSSASSEASSETSRQCICQSTDSVPLGWATSVLTWLCSSVSLMEDFSASQLGTWSCIKRIWIGLVWNSTIYFFQRLWPSSHWDGLLIKGEDKISRPCIVSVCVSGAALLNVLLFITMAQERGVWLGANKYTRAYYFEFVQNRRSYWSIDQGPMLGFGCKTWWETLIIWLTIGP